MSAQLARMSARLARLGPELEKSALALAREGAERAAREARALAPVDSGELRAGIRAVPDGQAGAALVSAAPHAAAVELGTSRMAPRPHLLPAAQAQWPRMREDAARALQSAAREVCK